MTGIGRTLAEQVSFMRERADELTQEIVLLEKRLGAMEKRPCGMDCIRAANALDNAACEYRASAEKRRDGTRIGDDQASERHHYATGCAEVAAWLRQLVRDAGPVPEFTPGVREGAEEKLRAVRAEAKKWQDFTDTQHGKGHLIEMMNATLLDCASKVLAVVGTDDEKES